MTVYYPIIAGLPEASYDLLGMGADVNAQGGNYGNALQAALNGGHEAIAKLLIEKGENINAQGGFYGNALQVAFNREHEAIAKLLIENQADLNAQEEYMETRSGQHQIAAKMLLQSC